MGQTAADLTADAVIIGAGHHGLVAAAELADAGWDVLVLEANQRVGGAVASTIRDGWVNDDYSACHPLAKASPVIQALELHHHGLEWAQTERVVTHVTGPGDESGALLHLDPEQTAAGLEADHPGDGQAWLDLVEGYLRVREPLLDALLTQWPPTTSALALVQRLGLRNLPDLARLALTPVSQLGPERFGGDRGRQLIAGNALHADLPLEAPGSGLFGWLMAMLAQTEGFPTPRGGTGALSTALARRVEAAGGQIRTGERVEQVVVAGGRAVGVRTAGGLRVRARRAVIADTSAPALYDRLLPEDAVGPGLRARLERFTWDLPTVKLNYRLSQRVPWRAEGARGAAVVHAGHDVDGLLQWTTDLAVGRVPDKPFAIVGQMTTIDPTRSPEGTETLWLYTHQPRGVIDDQAADRLADATERMLDGLAPGWRDTIVERWVQGPRTLEARNANLGDGGVGGGTQQLFQQAIWRPVAGLGGPRTHIPGLYLGSAAIHPGGGVHGGCGHLAAQAALTDSRPLGRVAGAAWRRGIRAVQAQPPRY